MEPRGTTVPVGTGLGLQVNNWPGSM